MAFSIGSLIELKGNIPGIPSGLYYIVDIRTDGAIALSETLGGAPLVPTGPIVGTPRLIDRDLRLAFPLDAIGWLDLTLEQYLNTSLSEYLQLPLGG